MAAASAALLVWFGKGWIPAQQRYFHERNLGTLRTVAAQIKAKVDNFDPALDHAIDTVKSHDLLRKYVKLFSPELEIVTFDPRHPVWEKVPPTDPASVRIQRVEGKNYLYIGYRHDGEHRKGSTPVALIARGDIEQAASPFLTRTDFDAMLLVDGQGATIVQQSSSGLELTSVERFLKGRPGADGSKEAEPFTGLHGSTSMTVATIGATDYMLYTQPVQLSLLRRDDTHTQAAEEWALCGLVRLDRFRAASSAIPITYWLWFGAMLALVVCAIPLLKLRVLSPRERLRRVDGGLAAAAAFALTALAAFTALDLHLFGIVVPSALDDQLRAVADSMAAHVQQEIAAVGSQMTELRGEANGAEMWTRLKYDDEEGHRNFAEIRQRLTIDDDPPTIDLESKRGPGTQCEPSWSCRAGVLSKLGEITYPFFKIMAWSDETGSQRIKWSTAAVVTPFINADEAKLPYSESIKVARRLAGYPDVPSAGVSVLLSPNTGEKLTVFWRALPERSLSDREPNSVDLAGETMATTPVSLTSPVLPKHVQFAVVDRVGRVQFHTDPARSLTENFFQESENHPKLKSLVAARDSGAIGGRYLGKAHRFYVRPLDVTPFGDPRWSLVVFQDGAVSETANLETINLAVWMFAVYAAALTALWALLRALWPDAVDRWLWPDRANGPAYRRAAVVNFAAAGAAAVALVELRPAALLSVAALLVAVPLLATFLTVGLEIGVTRKPSTAWQRDFFLARASLLFLLAAVPAFVCFRVAYAFHAELVAKRAQSHLAYQLDTRERRINAQARRVAICPEQDSGSRPCEEVRDLVARRTMQVLWDVSVPLAAGRAAGHDTELGSTLLRSFLTLAYRPYNDVAADLLMASPVRDRWRPMVDDERKPLQERKETLTRAAASWTFVTAVAAAWPVRGVSWLIAATLVAVAYGVVRWLLPPLFALDLCPAVPLPPPRGAADDASLLAVGPPGSARTRRLQQHPRVRVFDVRSLAFADEPAGVMRPAAAAVCVAADCGAIDANAESWVDAIEAATLDPLTIVAVDHLEHRFDDQVFRGRMLQCLEAAVYRRGATIWCSMLRDPIEQLDEVRPPAPDRPRWARLFAGFRREHLALEVDAPRADRLACSLQAQEHRLAAGVRDAIVSECRVAPELLAVGETLAARLPEETPDTSVLDKERALGEIGRAAAPFYEALWNSCSTDEKVVLRQLADEGLVNPNNGAAVLRQLRTGLVRRDRVFALMNETFRRFVMDAVSHDAITAWEHEGVRVPWGTIATTGLTVAFGLAGLLLLTQAQMVDAWISYVPAFAPALPTVWKVLAGVQKGRIEVTA